MRPSTALLESESASCELRRAHKAVRAVRVLAAAASSAAACVALNSIASGPLDVRTDVIGYPIFEGWNLNRYQRIYRLLVGVFPLLTAMLYWLSGKVPGLNGSALRAPRLNSYVASPEQPQPSSAPALAPAFATGRLALTGAALGLEWAIVQNSPKPTQDAILVACNFVLGAFAVTALWWWGRRDQCDLWCVVSVVSAVATALPLAGLYAVSSETSLIVQSTGTRHEYRWLPLWLTGVVSLAVLAFVIAAIRRAFLSASPREKLYIIERACVLYVSCGVLVFLFSAFLPGITGPLDAFHEGESLAALTTLRLGELPWRDSLGIHGLLLDYFMPIVGTQTFGDSRWASVAGQTMLLNPLVLVVMWWSLVRFLRSAWPVLTFAGALLALGSRKTSFWLSLFGTVQIRFLLLPLVLIAFGAFLSRRTRFRGVLFGAAAAVQFIVTPETAYLIVAMTATLVIATWFDDVPEQRWFRNVVPTAWAALGALGVMLPFLLWLLAVGALDDYVWYFRAFATDHALTGSKPFQWGTPYIRAFWIVLPPAVSVCFATFVLIRSRRRALPASDWTMFAVSLFTLVYFGSKFLGRPDDGHLFQVASTSAILVLYVSARLFATGWDLLRRACRDRYLFWRSLPVAIGGLLLAGLVINPVSPTVRALPQRVRPVVPSEPTIARLGYAEAPASDPTLVNDVGALLASSGIGVDDVFDFTNSPALFYYLLPYDPPTRYLHVSLAISADRQADLLAELSARMPKVVAFDSDRLGLPSWDGIANEVRHYLVSSWILDNYRPWAISHGYVFLQRDDLDLHVPTDNNAQPGGPELLLRTRGCAYGRSPSYMSWTPSGDEPQPVASERVVSLLTISGWAATEGELALPSSVRIATAAGRRLGTTYAALPRSDAPELGADASRAGFQITVGLTGDESEADLRIELVDGVGSQPTVLPLASAINGAWRVQLDAPVSTAPRDQTLRVQLPVDSDRSVDWAILDTGSKEPAGGSYSMSPDASFPEQQTVSWESGPGAPHYQAVSLSGCAQWRATTGAVYLALPPTAEPGDVALS